MTALPKVRMSVDQFLAWAEDQPYRYELAGGQIYAMAPETAGHVERKAAAHLALRTAIRRRGLNCYALADGMTVRIDESTAYEPDALVYCGSRLPPSALLVPDPVIVVEVLSPSTSRVDALFKLAGYFGVPSIQHYLIIDPNQRLIVHHQRGELDALITRIVREGVVRLEPPGIEINLDDIYLTD
jgi:Uma2 family endonuclease